MLCAVGDLIEDVVVQLHGDVQRDTDTPATITRRRGGSAASISARTVGQVDLMATFAALVQFDNRVERLWPAVPLRDGDSVRSAIGRIECGGTTNLHGGWLHGADSLAGLAGEGLKRVILLSDGCANEGLTDTDDIAKQCAQWAARGISTSTYGLGQSFNEHLMVNMARVAAREKRGADRDEDEPTGDVGAGVAPRRLSHGGGPRSE